LILDINENYSNRTVTELWGAGQIVVKSSLVIFPIFLKMLSYLSYYDEKILLPTVNLARSCRMHFLISTSSIYNLRRMKQLTGVFVPIHFSFLAWSLLQESCVYNIGQSK